MPGVRILSEAGKAQIMALHGQGYGARRIAHTLGHAVSSVKRWLREEGGGARRWNAKGRGALDTLLLAGVPREPGILPAPGEAGATFSACLGCGKRSAIVVAGLCSNCVRAECEQYRSRPIARGRCSGPHHRGITRDGVVIHERFTDGTGLCGACTVEHYSAVFSAMREAQTRKPPEPDSRGLYWDEKAGGWRLAR